MILASTSGMNRKLIVVALCLAATLACNKKEEAPAPEPAAPPAAATTETQPPAKPVVAPQPTVTLAAGAAIPASGVALWLIADDAKAGEKLAAWMNPQVADVTATASGPDAQPMVIANALNGHSVVRFDGEQNILMTNIDISPARMPEATIFAVFNSKTDAAEPLRKLYGDDNGSYDRAAGLDGRAVGKNYALFTGTGIEGDFQLEKEKPYLTADQFAAKDLSTWVNGHATLTKVKTEYAEALPNMYIGGTGTDYHEPWQGDLAEIIVYGRVMTDQERTQVENYLAKKYGIVVTRP
jgi:hypothetical protein